MRIEFFVPGRPGPSGSLSSYHNKKTGKHIAAPASRYKKPWMQAVTAFAMMAYRGKLLTGPISLSVEFVLKRPNEDWGTGKNKDKLKDSASKYHLKPPDLHKLIRSTEDALTGVIWNDDKQVVTSSLLKRYVNSKEEKTGALIVVEELV